MLDVFGNIEPYQSILSCSTLILLRSRFQKYHVSKNLSKGEWESNSADNYCISRPSVLSYLKVDYGKTIRIPFEVKQTLPKRSTVCILNASDSLFYNIKHLK